MFINVKSRQVVTCLTFMQIINYDLCLQKQWFDISVHCPLSCFKGVIECKIHFYLLFELKCVLAVCVHILSRICLFSNPVITRPHLISPEHSSSTPAHHQILITTRYLNTHLTSVKCPISCRHSWTQDSCSSFIAVNKHHHFPSSFVYESPSVTEDRTNTDG